MDDMRSNYLDIASIFKKRKEFATKKSLATKVASVYVFLQTVLQLF